MRIAVIAASGRLGMAFVEEALRAGHSVQAGVRGKHTFAPHPNLVVRECDATNPEDVQRLLDGQEVVVSAIGHVKGSKADVQTVATKAIVAAMTTLGLKRYIDVTGTGVRFAGDKITIMDRILNTSIELIDKARIEDGRMHQEVLKESGLEWTTIRVLKLQNVAPKAYSLQLHGPTKVYVGRIEVAKAMLEVIENHTFIEQAPILASS